MARQSTQTNGSAVWQKGWSDQSYWLDGMGPQPDLPNDLPDQADVVIVGSGYTGLNAAIETARGGKSTLVLEAGIPGFGCSTRNGGQISTSIKPSLDKLKAKYGTERGAAIRQEGETALEWIEQRISEEKIDCDFRRVGRFHGAHTPGFYDELAHDADKISSTEGIEAYAVPRAEQMSELGSDNYHGGVVFPRHAAVDPARYHLGLLNSAMEAGAEVRGNCAVTGITRRPVGFEIETEKGKVRAGQVIVATNGYTTAATPWLRRRVIPIGSYIIATETLPKELIDRLSPKDRIASDSRKVVYYFRASPDRTRILFGGRVSANETDPTISGPRLFEDMCRVFPDLRGYQISHSWMGTVAYTFDELAHTGTHDGVHYALGYCGSGVSMASYLGMRAGQKVLGLKEGQTAFDDLPFPTRPLYTGTPWFLPPVVAWYRWRDRMQYQRSMATG
ncbi:NAD(P)/FAD-dependent oxidoreductase [Roseovarius sp. 2305UL8-3]|uniref:NAD(P)/FAD-dependent oxidoreductase n=1 Tax=Roseovarius conchicola TaxID=3121636 RepID=UPI003529008B